MPSASPTNPDKIVEVVLLYSYSFGAILHSKMTLCNTNSRPSGPCRGASLKSLSELRAILRGFARLRSKEHKKAFEYNIA